MEEQVNKDTKAEEPKPSPSPSGYKVESVLLLESLQLLYK